MSSSVTEAHEQSPQTGKLKAYLFNQNYSGEKQPQTEFIQNHSTLQEHCKPEIQHTKGNPITTLSTQAQEIPKIWNDDSKCAFTHKTRTFKGS